MHQATMLGGLPEGFNRHGTDIPPEFSVGGRAGGLLGRGMKRFGKVSWLLAAGLVTVAAINGVLAYALSEVLTLSLLSREVAVSRNYLQSVSDAEDFPATLFAEPRPSPALKRLAAILEAVPGVVRANVYGPDRFIRHSTEPNLIGLKFETNGELEDGFKGEMTATLEEITADPKPEHLGLNKFAGKKFIEAYVPLSDRAGTVFAVVEYYAEADGLLGEAGQTRWIVILSELLAGLATLAALYAVFRPRNGDKA
jgi:two-component system sensor histidine kinase HydH